MRDLGLLEAAVARPRTTAFRADAYPSLLNKAAALLHSLAANHWLADGNKRTAWTATKLFLLMNGQLLLASPEEGEQFVVSVTHRRDWADLSAWLEAHCRRPNEEAS